MKLVPPFWRLLLPGIALLLAALASPAPADVKLPALVGDHMVLQRDAELPIWGWADPGEKVTVAIDGQTQSATADKSGKWMVRLDKLATSKPLTMKITGNNTLEIKDILVGEVWVCSGQSNMQWSVSQANNAAEEIAAAKFPEIRLISVPRVGTQETQTDFEGSWAACSPETVGSFSAVGYYFGRTLFQELKVPIGLIHCSWGGSACEAWVETSVLAADPELAPILQRWEQIVKSYDPEKQQQNYEAALEKWKVAAAKAKADGKPQPRRPFAPRNPLIGQHRPANLYRGMLNPLIPYAIRGAIWYQGETNAGRAYQYRTLFPTMITSWRKDWGQGDFPFYFVQLANFRQRKNEPAPSDWAELREAQSMTLSLPNTGQAVIIDIGEANDIHPKNKQDVGKRLALWALAHDYGQDVEFSGPSFESLKVSGDKAIVTFNHAEGLTAKGGTLKGFSVAGKDEKFHWADATIEGNKVVVSSPDVKQPVAVRYAWADNPEANLYNKAGLPASPFRTDDWKGVTADAR